MVISASSAGKPEKILNISKLYFCYTEVNKMIPECVNMKCVFCFSFQLDLKCKIWIFEYFIVMTHFANMDILKHSGGDTQNGDLAPGLLA